MTKRESRLIKVLVGIIILGGLVVLSQAVLQGFSTKLEHLKILRTQLAQWEERKAAYPPRGDLSKLKASIEGLQHELEAIQAMEGGMDRRGEDTVQTLKSELVQNGFTIKSISLEAHKEVEFLALGPAQGLVRYLERLKVIDKTGGVQSLLLQTDARQGMIQVQIRITYD